ncbi:MAG: hypothetical protein ACKOYM_01710, partial [Actinomycetes bacterium]
LVVTTSDEWRSTGVDGPALVLRSGPPAWCVAAATPLLVVFLVGRRLADDGLRRQFGEPISPWWMLVVTVALAVFVVWRAVTQRGECAPDALRCRNLLVTFEVAWIDIERLQVVRRLGLVVVDVHVRGLRRAHRLGAATRFVGSQSDAVIGLLRAFPASSGRLVDAS